MGKGRGRLSSIQLLPEEASTIVSWATAELNRNKRTQIDIYDEFVARLEELKRQYDGKLEFEIPALRSFSRHSFRLARVAEGLNRTREVVEALRDFYDPKASDDLTIMATEAIKAAVFEHYEAREELKLTTKNLKEMADAIRSATQAQNTSTARLQKTEKEVVKAVDSVAKAKGLSAETAEEIKAKILGVRE